VWWDTSSSFALKGVVSTNAGEPDMDESGPEIVTADFEHRRHDTRIRRRPAVRKSFAPCPNIVSLWACSPWQPWRWLWRIIRILRVPGAG
jgi:hypothetical protein